VALGANHSPKKIFSLFCTKTHNALCAIAASNSPRRVHSPLRRNYFTMDAPKTHDFGSSASPRSRAHTHSGSRPRTTSVDVEAEGAFIHPRSLSPTSQLGHTSLDRPPIPRLNRSNTVVHYSSSAEQPSGSAIWGQSINNPGAEPGIDPAKTALDDLPYANLSAVSQVTLVDFSDEKVDRHEMYNDDFIDFMKNPRPDWATCRWINVNGLSWDVISCLGKRYKLHRLAIEDLIHARGRAKADWYPSHVYGKSSTSVLDVFSRDCLVLTCTSN
jgi:hypothetical protein